MMKPRTKIEEMGDFIYGQTIQETILNAFIYKLRYAAIPMGIEHSFAAVNRRLRTKFYTTCNIETKKNINIMRLEPDAQIISPTGNVIKLEIKAADYDSVESFFRSSIWGLNNVEQVLRFYPTTRFIFVNIRLRKITSISGLDLLDEEACV